MAPALAAGNCVVLEPARLTPLSVLLLMEIVGDLLPPGVVNVVNGAGGEIGEYLATSKRIAKVAFTGSTEVGQQIMQYATQNIIPVTLELGGKSPNIFFADVMDEEDAFFDKALEGFALFAFNGRSLHLSESCLSAGVNLRTLYGTRHPPCRKHSQR